MHQTHKLFLLEFPIYSMNRSCLERILDSTLKQSCSHQKFWGWEYKKHPTKKCSNYKQGLRILLWTLKVVIDNLIGSKYLYSTNKSNKHLTIYDSCNAECAARVIKKSSYRTNRTRTVQQIRWNSNDTQKHLLWKQYVAWHCNSYNPTPISDYITINNPVFQELLLESDYFRWKNLYWFAGQSRIHRRDWKTEQKWL